MLYSFPWYTFFVILFGILCIIFCCGLFYFIGYPLAYVATRLMLGQSLVTMRNPVNNCTSACFEPAMDYVALKVTNPSAHIYVPFSPEIF